MFNYKASLFAFALFAVASPALAQPWDWDRENESRFYERYSREPHKAPSVGFSLNLGGIVPDDIDMYDAPADYDYAPARKYRYFNHNKLVYVVDPKTRKVVRVIEK
ncbi:MAG: DUF1236 domain-containing protein [Beijerinckiaceae bacterium]